MMSKGDIDNYHDDMLCITIFIVNTRDECPAFKLCDPGNTSGLGRKSYERFEY